MLFSDLNKIFVNSKIIGKLPKKKIKFISDNSKNISANTLYVINKNICILKLFNHYDRSKIIIVSLIDNLIKGAAGQAVQCFNLSQGFDESSALTK